MKRKTRKEEKEAGIQLSLFIDQITTIDKKGNKLEPTALEKILKNKKGAGGLCIYKNENKELSEGCCIVEYIHKNSNLSVLLPDITTCGPKCPYFIQNK